MPQHRKGRALPWIARWHDAYGRQRSKAFRTKTEALDYERRMRIAVADGTLYDDDRRKMPVAVWVREHVARQSHLADTTRARYEGVIDRQIEPMPIGGLAVGQVRATAVEEWALQLTHEQNLAPRTVEKALDLLGQSMSAAVRDGIIPSNPCEHVAPPRAEREEMLWLTPDEVERVAVEIDRRVRTPWRGDVVVFLAYTGLRWSEMCRLTVGDVDLRRSPGRVRVARRAKSEAGFRSVPVAARIVPILKAACDGKKPGDAVFTAPSGATPRNSNFRQRWKVALRRAGLDEDVRIHDLRHSCATWLINNGAEPHEVARWLGHASVQVTWNTYTHLWPDRLDAAAAALDRAAGDQRRGMRLVEEA